MSEPATEPAAPVTEPIVLPPEVTVVPWDDGDTEPVPDGHILALWLDPCCPIVLFARTSGILEVLGRELCAKGMRVNGPQAVQDGQQFTMKHTFLVRRQIDGTWIWFEPPSDPLVARLINTLLPPGNR